MCGGGTILMEAVLLARHIAPGLGRRFAFEKLQSFDSKAWRDLCEASRTAQAAKAAPVMYGSDRDGRALQAARANFDAAGLADAVVLTEADVLDMKPPDRKSTRLNSSHRTISYAVFCLKKTSARRSMRSGLTVSTPT